MHPTGKFEHHISIEQAYRLICTSSAVVGERNSLFARIWIRRWSWYDERLQLSDGSYIYREPYVDAHFIHSNLSTEDVLDLFNIGKSAQMFEYAVENNIPVTIISKGGK